MTYKLNPEVRKIISPVALTFGDGADEQRFPNGEALANAEFDKNYCIEAVSARDDCVVLTVQENRAVNTMNWAGEEAVSFF